MRRLVELSHAVVPGAVTYPGLPTPVERTIVDFDASRAHYDHRAEFAIKGLDLCGNTGTYVDAPAHRFRDGADLAALPLDRLADLPVVVVDATASSHRAISEATIPRGRFSGCAVLVHTGWDRHFGTPAYGEGHPFLTGDAAAALVDGGAAFVGIDSLNIDDTDDGARPVHTRLLGAGIPVCEHMTNLAAVPDGSRLHAVPIAWRGGTSFPVRAYVVVEVS